MTTVHKPHLVIIGGGSAAFTAATKAHELGARITLINDGLPLGGCCINVGCIPSKTLLRAAEAHHRGNHSRFDGVTSQSRITDFSKIIDQKNRIIGDLRKEKYLQVISRLSDARVIQGFGHLVNNHIVAVGDERIEADRILIATGSAPFIPPIPGLASVNYLTHETAFDLKKLPASIIILGGRFVALECAQMFARLGSKVTVIQRSSRILPTETSDLTASLTTYLSEEGITFITGATTESVYQNPEGVTAVVTVAGETKTVKAAKLLLATGRTPNTAVLGLQEQGVACTEQGYIQVDATLATSVPGIYAAGDVLGEHQFVYTAAYEGGLAASNCFSEQPKERNYTGLPWVLFTDPQVAGVGLDEKQAFDRGIEAETSTLPLTQVPRAITAQNTRGFFKLIREKGTDRLLGARVLASEGSEVLMEISLAIQYDIPVKALASQFHPYLTLSEAIKLAAIQFDKDIRSLSCCGV